ncbi:MAG: hypothetical protein RR572_05190 [Raoultibacter sp.]
MLSIEAAFVYPAFFLMIFLVAQFSWIGFQVACLDHGLYAMGWTLDAERAETSADTSALIASAIQDDWMPLNAQNLSVHKGRAELTASSATQATRDERDHEVYLLERSTVQRRFMHISADVDYRIDLLVQLPGFEGVTITRHLDKTQLVNEKFEVS